MKKYTQFGTFIVLVISPILFFTCIGMLGIGLSADAESIILLLTCLTMLACLLVFYKLTILIDNEHVSFKFGMGWFGKKYKLSEIDSCVPVKNQVLHGIGIRFIGNGWLYNVSGLKAIELRFKNKKSVVRIGTDKPEEICELVRERLSETKK